MYNYIIIYYNHLLNLLSPHLLILVAGNCARRMSCGSRNVDIHIVDVMGKNFDFFALLTIFGVYIYCIKYKLQIQQFIHSQTKIIYNHI